MPGWKATGRPILGDGMNGEFDSHLKSGRPVGAVAFPATWLVVAVLVAWGGNLLVAGYPTIHYSPLLTGLIAFALSWLGGILVVHFRQIASEAKRALGVRFTLTRRRQAVNQLLEQRAALYERFVDLDARLEGPRATDFGVRNERGV